jgi:transcriptional regulator with XRE-family HTH domain
VSDNWTAVSREVNSRAAELGLKQRELAERSGVSLAIVREIQQDKVYRNRNPRTLEALSVALQRHPQHLTAVLAGKTPPAAGQAPTPKPDSVVVALNTLQLGAVVDSVNHSLAKSGLGSVPGPGMSRLRAFSRPISWLVSTNERIRAW